MQHPGRDAGRKSTLITEFLIGLLAVALGGVSLALELGLLAWNVQIPRQVNDVVLILVGFFLWLTAFRLWSHRYHTSRLF